MNKAIMIGRLASTPEVRTTQSGKKVATFKLATDRKMKDKDGNKVADFHTVILWGKLAELAEMYLEKGRQVAIDGEVQNRSYTDKEGNKRFITEIVADEMEFLSSGGSKVKAEERLEGFKEVTDENLPF